MTRKLALSTALLFLSCALAGAADWPAYRGPQRNGISTETNIADHWPDSGPKKLWSTRVGIGYSSPVAVDGRVYMFSTMDGKDTLQAHNADDGQLLWSSSYDNSWTGQYPGTRCSPVIEGNRIYTYGGAGDLACWDLSSGKPVWQINILRSTNAKPLTWGQASNPLIVGDLIYIQGGQGPFALAVNKADGKIAWKSENGLGGYAQPVLVDVEGTRQLIIFSGDSVYGLDPKSGKTYWKQAWKTKYDINAATPIYHDGNLFVTSNYGSGCMMLKVSASSAQELWRGKQVESRFQGPILLGDNLYANSEGTVKCINWPDGKVKWAFQDKEFKIDMGGSLVLAGDKLIMLSQSGKLALANLGETGPKIVSQFQAVKGREVWSSPLIYNGKLYAKGEQDFTCFDISKQ